MKTKESNKALVKESLHLIDNWLNFQTYIKELPGIAVGIFLEDEIIFQKEYGYANLETKTKLTKDHLFRIASHSKLFTATAIMKLYHEDKLSIDDRVNKYLPWFISEKDANIANIRIRHLLTHSSGMTRDGETAHWQTYQFPDLSAIKEQVKAGISFFETSELLKYSNFGYTLLGQIIEKVSGKDYHTFVQEEILQPLKMTNTVTDVTATNEKKHAKGYKIKFPNTKRGKFEHVKAKIMHSATGLSSNVEDLLKFYQAHMLGNNTLFPDYIKREMQRTQFRAPKTDWGLGFNVLHINESKLVGHGGGYPGFITRSGLFPDEKLVIVVLTNAVDGPAYNLLIGIYKIFKLLEKKKSEFTAKTEKPLPNLDDVIGFYQSDWGISLFSQIGSKLVLISPFAENPAEFMQIYTHKEGLTFTAPSEFYGSSPGQDIVFEDGPDGQKIFVDSHKGKQPKFHFSY